jgi:hypothetical protein
MLLDLNLEHLSDGLVGRGEEMIGQHDVLAVCQRGVMADRRVQIEQ